MYIDGKKPAALTTIVLLLSVSLLNSYGLAQRVDTVINDSWRFYKGTPSGSPQNVVYDDSSWEVVNLPHTYNAFDTQDGGGYYRGPAWYRKNINISSGYSGKRVYLFFEAVGKAADVYCNGTFIGRHEGAYAAFCFDITDQVNFGSDNLIAVRSDNSDTSILNIIPRSGDFNQYGGICRTVRMVVTKQVHITLLDYASPGIYLTPTNVSASSADLEVKALIRNTEASAQSVTVRAQIYDAADMLVDTLQTTQSVSAGSTQTVTQNTVISNPHLWNGLADPYLYKVITEVEVSSVVVDLVEQPLGFRYYSVDPDNGFFLNGQYLDLHGVAMHEDRRDKGRAISDADREQDIALMLEMGCNWIRPSHYQHAEKFYDLADENGIVLSTEIPIVNSITFDTDFVNNCKDQLRELIRQNYNHPSVFFWLLYNELTTGGSETVIQQLHDLAKAEDPTRLTTVAHNNTSDYAAWSYITDTLAYNRYMGWYGGTPYGFAPWADDIHANRSTDEIGIMEYGAGANPFQHQVPPVYPGPSTPLHPEEYQSYYHEVYWNAMKVRPFIWCKTIWNGFDFAVDWRDEGSQIALNDKGMVTRDRTVKKDTFYWYKANWTTEPMVYITSRRFTPQYTCPQYVKVYSNCDTVELFINDVSMGTKTGTDCIFNWDNGISLRPGNNIIKAVGVAGANECNDLCIWELNVSGDFNDCAYMRSINCGYISDFNGHGGQPDCYVDFLDFAEVGKGWLVPEPDKTIYEAEDALLGGPTVETTHSGYTGTGYADYSYESSGDYTEWTVNVPAAGLYTLDFRYANGSGDRPLRIEVNGSTVYPSFSFPSTGGWSSWKYVSTDVDLISGNNTVRTTSIGSMGPNIDHLVVYLVSDPTYDMDDLAILAREWLLCNDPQNPECSFGQ